MPRIQIPADKHLEFLELYRLWATELPLSEQRRANTLVEGAWETVADHVEITFKVDDLFLAFLSQRRFRYRKI
jgi:hypothetical protein